MNRTGSKGKPINSGQRKTVLNVFNYLQNYHPHKKLLLLPSLKLKRTSQATRQSERSIYRFRQEEDKGELLSPRKNQEKYNLSIPKRDCFFYIFISTCI